MIKEPASDQRPRFLTRNTLPKETDSAVSIADISPFGKRVQMKGDFLMDLSFKNEFENMACERMTMAMRELREKPEYIKSSKDDRDAMLEIAYYTQGIKDGVSLFRILGVSVGE